MKKEDSRGNKLNKGASIAVGAVRTGAGKIAAFVGRSCRGMRLWQKAGLLVCVFFWIFSYVISLVCGRITGAMQDQNYASRWALEGGSSQVSAYFSDTALMSDESVEAMQAHISQKLTEASIGLSEQQIENGASLYDIAYCGFGMAEISTPSDSVTVTAIGVGGDFFNFHPLKLMSGYYFSEDESMKDRIMLDDRTAWRLFGSPDIVGESVDIGGKSHYIAGVFRAPTERFYKQSGMGDYLIYISFDSLCKYTEKGVPSNEEGSEESDDSMMDALAPAPGGMALGVKPADWKEGSVLQSKTERVDAVSLFRNVELPPAHPIVLWKPDESLTTHKVYSSPSRERLVGFDSVSDLADEDMDSGEEDPESGADSAAEEEGEETEETDDKDEDSEVTGDDAPVGESLNRGGAAGGYYSGGADNGEREEVNRARISCYEAVLPDPITNFALNTLNACLTETGVDSSQKIVVQNTGRFDSRRLALMMAQPGLRSMQSVAIRYPYWENVARAWEDVLIPFAFLELFMRFSPFLFLLFLLLWYATHRNWTVGGWIEKAREKMYDRQAERIHGRGAAAGRLGEAAEKSLTDSGIDAGSFSAEAEAAVIPGKSFAGAADFENPPSDITSDAWESPTDVVNVEKNPAEAAMGTEDSSSEAAAGIEDSSSEAALGTDQFSAEAAAGIEDSSSEAALGTDQFSAEAAAGADQLSADAAVDSGQSSAEAVVKPEKAVRAGSGKRSGKVRKKKKV